MRHIFLLITGVLSAALPATAFALSLDNADQIFNEGAGSSGGYADEETAGSIDLLSAQAFVEQGTKLARYAAYVNRLGDYAEGAGAPEDIVSEIRQDAGRIEVAGRTLRSAQQIRLTSDQAAEIIAEAVAALGASMGRVGQSGSDLSGSLDGMTQLGQTMLRVAQNLKSISAAARKNGGNIELSSYKRQLDAVDYLLVATKFLDSSIKNGRSIQARINSSVSAERGTTYQYITFSGLDSVDELGTINRDTGYFWDFGDGEFATGSSITHLFTQPNNYVVHLYVLGPSGFGMETTRVLIAPVKPVAVISTDQEPLVGPHDDVLSVVQGQNILLSAKNSFDPAHPDQPLRYRWDFGDGSIDDVTSDTVYHAFSEPRDYKVLLLVTTKDQLADSMVKIIRVTRTPPEARFSVKNEANNVRAEISKDFFTDHASRATTLLFDASASRGAPGALGGTRVRLVSAEWSFGDGTNPVRQTERELASSLPLRHTFEKPGRYEVTLTLTDSLKSSGSATKTVVLVDPALPTADFHADVDGELTTHRTVNFDAGDARSNLGVITAYAWELRLVKQDVLKTGSNRGFQVSFDAPGPYELALVTKDATGAESPRVIQRLNVLSTPPRAAFTFRRSSEEPNVFIFDASASLDLDPGDALSYSWDFGGDGQYEEVKRSVPNTTHRFDRVGASTVTLRVSDGFNRTTTVSRKVQVDSTLVVRIQPLTPAAGASPLSVNFLGAAYLNLAEGHDVNNVRSFEWDFGDGTRANMVSQDGTARITHVFRGSGALASFPVSLTATDAFGNRRRTSITVVVGAPGEVVPLLAIQPELPERGTTATSYLFSAAQSVSARGLTSGLAAAWDFGDGTAVKEGLNVQHRYARPGKYTVTLTVTDARDGKLGRITRALEVLREPATALLYASPADGKAPLTVNFDAGASQDPLGPIAAYIWDFGDGSVQQQAQPRVSHVYKTAGTYAAKLTIIDSTGSKVGADAVTITVN